MVVGQGDGHRFPVDSGSHPASALRAIARSVLATPPCVVAFSGGRDSSALLALLVDEARRAGLPEPVAVTARWDEDEASDEST
jgi:tRNA(Ile)-lysidine synthase TilS/MesJ